MPELRHRLTLHHAAGHGHLPACSCSWQAREWFPRHIDAAGAYGEHLTQVTLTGGPR